MNPDFPAALIAHDVASPSDRFLLGTGVNARARTSGFLDVPTPLGISHNVPTFVALGQLDHLLACLA